MFINLFDWLFSLVEKLDYLGITVLMTIESSFIPFPSELVIPPAAYLAQQGKLNILLVIAFGILGSLLGALINYILALSLGRTILYTLAKSKLAKVLLISEAKLEKSEQYFLKHGKSSTFFGRLVPVVRQLISIPAGLSKMNIFKFCLYTFLGASIWVIVLALTGYFFAQEQDLIFLYYKEIVLTVMLIVLTVFMFRKYTNKKYTNKKDKKSSDTSNEDAGQNNQDSQAN